MPAANTGRGSRGGGPTEHGRGADRDREDGDRGVRAVAEEDHAGGDERRARRRRRARRAADRTALDGSAANRPVASRPAVGPGEQARGDHDRQGSRGGGEGHGGVGGAADDRGVRGPHGRGEPDQAEHEQDAGPTPAGPPARAGRLDAGALVGRRCRRRQPISASIVSSGPGAPGGPLALRRTLLRCRGARRWRGAAGWARPGSVMVISWSRWRSPAREWPTVRR